MDIWIVMPIGYEANTRAFTNEKKAKAYKTKWEREVVEVVLIKSELNKEFGHVTP